jgi:hypothetical protein
MKYYLAGPMSNIPQFNFPAFFAATTVLRGRGFTIISPAEIDNSEDKGAALASKDGDPNNRDHMNGKTWGDFLARDVKLIVNDVDGIIFLPHWISSKGARLEAYVALMTGKTEFAFYFPDNGELRKIPPDFIRNELRSNMP